jgi:hypothetical protein
VRFLYIFPIKLSFIQINLRNLRKWLIDLFWDNIITLSQAFISQISFPFRNQESWKPKWNSWSLNKSIVQWQIKSITNCNVFKFYTFIHFIVFIATTDLKIELDSKWSNKRLAPCWWCGAYSIPTLIRYRRLFEKWEKTHHEKYTGILLCVHKNWAAKSKFWA